MDDEKPDPKVIVEMSDRILLKFAELLETELEGVAPQLRGAVMPMVCTKLLACEIAILILAINPTQLSTEAILDAIKRLPWTQTIATVLVQMRELALMIVEKRSQKD